MRVWRTVAGFTALVGIMGIASADAQPARIILLRHGEKRNARELCDVGNLRAQALSAQYLGKGAPGNTELFGAGKSPDAFFAVTAHTKETAAPSAGTWGKKLTIFPVLPKDPEEETDLDTQTQKAAAALELRGVRRQDRRRCLGAQAHRQRQVGHDVLEASQFGPASRIARRAGYMVWRELRLLLDCRLCAWKSEAGSMATGQAGLFHSLHKHSGKPVGRSGAGSSGLQMSGVRRELGELFEAVTTLSAGIQVKGDRLTVVTNGGPTCRQGSA